MDNVTHSLLGAALAKTRLGQSTPLAPVALVVAANLPDFENFVLAFFDRPTNMVHHRGLSHALVGVAILIPTFATLVWWLSRRIRASGPPGSFATLLLGTALAVGSHPLLDWLNTYGVRPWLPFDETWYYGDLVFIVDPWLWLLLGSAVCLAGRRTRGGSVALGIVGVLLSIGVILFADLGPRVLLPLWLAGVTALALGRCTTFGVRSPHAVVGAALALCVVYVGFLGWAGRTAWRMSQPLIAAQLPADEAIVAHSVSPQPANPLRWQVVAQTRRAVYRHTFSILTSPGGLTRISTRLDDPRVQAALQTHAGRAWQAFARHPVAAVVSNGGRPRVYLMDARYGLFPAGNFASVIVDVGGALGR